MRKILLATLLTACASADRVTKLEQEVADLKEQLGTQDKSDSKANQKEAVADLSKKLAAAQAKNKRLSQANKKGAKAAAQTNPEARKLFQEAQELMKNNKTNEAKAKLTQLVKDHSSDRFAKNAQKMLGELSVFGKDAPKNFSVTKWLTNEKSGKKISFEKGTTFIVFWELWCPHCKREIPKIDAMYKKLKSKGINIVGLTTLSKNRTEDQVNEFLASKKVSYPVAHHDGSINPKFAVRGIPAAAVVKNGKIVWRGHPARMTEEQLLAF